MKNKNEEAFLKSVSGATPITKTEKLKKIISPTKKITIKVIEGKQGFSEIVFKEKTQEIKKSFFTIEKSTINKKLKKGKIPIDKKIDLHGFSVLNAESIFEEMILRCYKKNLRCLLFITGKGILKKNQDYDEGTKLYYGKIRNNFFSWIKKPEMQKYILSIEPAGIEHGADGAFFVYLRKQKF